MLLLVDFSKAFDSISFSFINQAIEAFGLHPKIIEWINILMYNFESIAMVNGNPPPKRIKLGRECRQGDPIAGYLFILCIEILLLKVANNQHIKSWTSAIGNKHICDGYADDLNIYLKLEGIEDQITQLLKIFKDFQDVSGLKININKTKYVLFCKNGTNSSRPAKNGTNPKKTGQILKLHIKIGQIPNSTSQYNLKKINTSNCQAYT